MVRAEVSHFEEEHLLFSWTLHSTYTCQSLIAQTSLSFVFKTCLGLMENEAKAPQSNRGLKCFSFMLFQGGGPAG